MNVTAEPNDDELALRLPRGYCDTLIVAAYSKRELALCKMTNNEKLELLEELNKLVDRSFPAEALAVVQPMDDASMEIVHEARKLDGPWRTCTIDGMQGTKIPPDESYRMLTSERVFRILADLNPSFTTAAKIMLGLPGKSQQVGGLVTQETALSRQPCPVSGKPDIEPITPNDRV